MVDFLAWYQYPEPMGRTYSARELNDPGMVREVFDYCQIGLAIISARGWQYLIRTHGTRRLLEINKISGWFDTIDDAEAEDELRYHCLIAGYDPDRNVTGRYDEQVSTFAEDFGDVYPIHWGRLKASRAAQ